MNSIKTTFIAIIILNLFKDIIAGHAKYDIPIWIQANANILLAMIMFLSITLQVYEISRRDTMISKSKIFSVPSVKLGMLIHVFINLLTGIFFGSMISLFIVFMDGFLFSNEITIQQLIILFSSLVSIWMLIPWKNTEETISD